MTWSRADETFWVVRPCRVTSSGSWGSARLTRFCTLTVLMSGSVPSEGDVQRVAAVGAAGRLHVEHVVDAVDLLLDRLGDALFDHLGARPRIAAGHLHLRWHDVGILGDRNREDRDQAGERDYDRDDEGEPRPLDEDVGDHRLSLPPAAG